MCNMHVKTYDIYTNTCTHSTGAGAGAAGSNVTAEYKYICAIYIYRCVNKYNIYTITHTHGTGAGAGAAGSNVTSRISIHMCNIHIYACQ